MLAISLCLGLIACGDDEEEVVVPPTELSNPNNNPDNPDNHDNGDHLSAEAAKFVGKWAGRGPLTTYNGAIKSTPPGIWIFKEDGTFNWNCNPISGYVTEQSGEWHYNPEIKMIIANSASSISFNWKVLEITDNSWTGEASFGGTQTYSRVVESN